MKMCTDSVLRFARHSRNRFRGGGDGGFSLIVVLLLMVALAFIGVSAMRNVTLQEKMAGNMYTRTIAAQESEAGLRYAKQKSEAMQKSITQVEAPGTATLPGRLTALVNNATQSFWSTASNWSGAQTIDSLDATRPVTVAVAMEQMAGNNPYCATSGGSMLGSGQQSCPVIFIRASSRANDSATGATAIFQSWSMYPAD